jgi:hypothetical protein
MKKGTSYTYTQMEAWAKENDYYIRDYGQGRIGAQFIVLTNNHKDLDVSFVLTGTQGDEYIFECIYTDVK